MRDLWKNDEWDLEDIFGDLFRPAQMEKRAMSMRTDIKENENSYELDIDMPGFDKNEINVTLENGYLNVSAKKTKTQEEIFTVTSSLLSGCSKNNLVPSLLINSHPVIFIFPFSKRKKQ